MLNLPKQRDIMARINCQKAKNQNTAVESKPRKLNSLYNIIGNLGKTAQKKKSVCFLEEWNFLKKYQRWN